VRAGINADCDREQEHQVSQPSTTASIHPSLRNILDMPEPAPPRPRPGIRTQNHGPTRVRRIPGPPPPKSWLLAHSRYASVHAADRAPSERIQHQSIRLPDAFLVRDRSLQHALLKSLALNWSWHAENDHLYLTQIPTRLRETLLSYIALFGADDADLRNPLRVLFPLTGDIGSMVQDDSEEVKRLDLTNALGRWLSMKALRRNLLITAFHTGQTSSVYITSPTVASSEETAPQGVPDSWEDESESQHDHHLDLPNIDPERERIPFADSRDPDADEGDNLSLMGYASTHRYHPSSNAPLQASGEPPLSAKTDVLLKPIVTPRFPNLRHLSLALDPTVNTSTVSWASLLSVAVHLPTLESLSLAYWPLPTYTPKAASTFATISDNVLNRSVAYGGTNMYSAIDNDWRESAGVLRSLSRSLYCLKWLDLTGCLHWLPALAWEDTDTPLSSDDDFGTSSATSPSPSIWNGHWRGITWLGLGVGWAPTFENDVSTNVSDTVSRHYKILQEKPHRVAKQIQQKRLSGKGHAIHFDYADGSAT
jgi:hypothetical protein